VAWFKSFDPLATDIVHLAVEVIITLLGEHEHEISGTVDTASLPRSRAAMDTEEHLVVMCKLLQEQKREAVLRNSVSLHLDRLGPALAELPEAQKLLDFYRPAPKGQGTAPTADSHIPETNIVDSFGKEICGQFLDEIEKTAKLPIATDLPDLNDEEIEALSRARATYYYDKYEDTTQAGEDGGDDGDGDGDDGDGDGDDEDDTMPEDTSEDSSTYFDWLENWYSTIGNTTITLPGWRRPEATPFDVQDVPQVVEKGLAQAKKKIRATKKSKATSKASEEGPEVPAGTIFALSKRSHSFVRGRQISDNETKNKLATMESLVQEATFTTKAALRGDKVNVQYCCDFAQALLKMTQRPSSATDPKQRWKLDNYTSLALEDDWWHVRKLFSALRYKLDREGSGMGPVLDKAEVRLACLIGIIGAGAEDVVPWVLCVEHLLREMWGNINKAMNRVKGEHVHCSHIGVC
jgi:hypothetical protein